MSSIEFGTHTIFHLMGAALKRAVCYSDEFRRKKFLYTPLRGNREFRAVLANQFALAAEARSNLAVLYLDAPQCPPEQQQRIAVFLCSVVTKLGNLFMYSPSCFALLLPETSPVEAARLALVMLELLRAHFPESRIRTNIAAYPNVVQSLEGFDALAPGCAPPATHGGGLDAKAAAGRLSLFPQEDQTVLANKSVSTASTGR